MSLPRSAPAVLTAVLVLGSAAACGEDEVYDDDGPLSPGTQTTAPAQSAEPGLADAGTASPIPTRGDDVGIGGQERSDGQDAEQ
ncbi:hypothetical protein [Sporichthya polymorpha]|uniref:hypothetical protein n=1 Tax=Sporichthya polymorpha TaxID=35751 RepID=UPI000361A8CD|nr:hypothetical protein [Sporichthya polymorpha]